MYTYKEKYTNNKCRDKHHPGQGIKYRQPSGSSLKVSFQYNPLPPPLRKP